MKGNKLLPLGVLFITCGLFVACGHIGIGRSKGKQGEIKYTYQIHEYGENCHRIYVGFHFKWDPFAHHFDYSDFRKTVKEIAEGIIVFEFSKRGLNYDNIVLNDPISFQDNSFRMINGSVGKVPKAFIFEFPNGPYQKSVDDGYKKGVIFSGEGVYFLEQKKQGEQE